ncbi:MAG: NAD(+) synthase [Cyclobacteriaceae bacterium]
MSKKFRIGGACLNQTPIDWKNNLDNIKLAIDQARAKEVDILCLPELCITGYGCEDLFLSDWLPVTALEKLETIVSWTEGIAVTVGLPIRTKGHIFNATCFIANKEIRGFYAKQKLANDGVHYEPRWFTPWKSGEIHDFEWQEKMYPFGHVSFSLDGTTIGFEICEDAWRNERPADHYQTKVDLILNPSASHFAFKKAKFREDLVCTSSRELDCVYLYTNLLGNEAGRMIYDGDILIANKGELIGRNKRLSFQDYNLLTVDIDFATGKCQKNLNSNFDNQNEEFTQAASLALIDYLRKSHSKGYVLSLSGGADSSTIATLIAETVRRSFLELGRNAMEKKIGFDLVGDSAKEFVNQLLTTAYQATKNSSSETFDSARNLADSIGAKFYSWEIDEQVNTAKRTIEQAIGRQLSWDQDDITLQNIQARSRSPVIWMLANLNNALLLATSNRSEGDVGYATMDGDTSGSISPIAGLPKTFVLQWLKYAESSLGYSGLTDVNNLTPTAELRPENKNQTDEEDLMPYDVLKQIELEAILNGKSPKQIYDLLKDLYDEVEAKDWIKKFFQLWTRNQWKRERYAPSFHFDDFNIDPRSWYRFPILSGGYTEELENL